MKYYNIDIEAAQALDIVGPELMLFSALRFFTNFGPYTKGLRKLAEESLVGSKDVVNSALKKLIAKGLVQKDENGIIISQYANEMISKTTRNAEFTTTLSENTTDETEYSTQLSKNSTLLRERSKENINKVQ